jgi:hypothetical protein
VQSAKVNERDFVGSKTRSQTTPTPVTQDEINKPVFVVGSPRSGTSILTWCLGQHPNMFPVPESNWMGDFALNVAISHRIGSARANRSVLSAMNIEHDEFFASFGKSINDLILSHRTNLDIKRDEERAIISGVSAVERDITCGSKPRWVDGTPEYSVHIFGLRKLFPEAVFIHILRDVREVVRSMLNFHRAAGTQLVANEEEAYKYWLRTVTACVQAEEAYGPKVVYRLPYTALIDSPESAMRSLLDFVGEPYNARCLEPLGQRINSSNVPEDFVAENPATNPAIVTRAKKLSDELQSSPQQREASATVAEKLEAEFDQRVQYFYDLERKYSEAEQLIVKLQKEREALRPTPKAANAAMGIACSAAGAKEPVKP